MEKRYPFKFLDAYNREDKDFFFGRQEEIDALYKMTFQANIMLLYGATGTGKTSLIQCGLANKFQTYDWLALYVRRGKSFITSLDRALCEESGEAFTFEETETSGITHLADKIKAVYSASFKPIYLIFDQFEELYILGSKDEQAQFVRTVQDILYVEQPVKIILSIREEYLGYLYEFERQVPELRRKKMRIEPMFSDRVQQVILGVGSLPQSNVKLQAGEETAIATRIFDKLRGQDKTLSIQLPYLQVLLDKYYLHCTGDESRQAEATFTLATLDTLGDLDDVLRNFLDEQVQHIARQLTQPVETLWQLLSPFVTLDGTKEPLSESELYSRLPDDFPKATAAPALQAFVQRRVLRYMEQTARYEVAHDTLAKQLHARRSDEEIALLEVQRLIRSQVAIKAEAREYFSAKQLAFILEVLPKLRLTAEEKGWVEESRLRQESRRAAERQKLWDELEQARRQAEKERQLLKKAEASEKRARQRFRLAGALALLAVAVAVWAFVLKKQATESDSKTKVALAKADKLINAFYFYDGKYALAYGKKGYGNVFYFIDTLGKEVKHLGRWDKAEQFDWRGYAKTSRIKKFWSDEPAGDYLLDIFGNTYPVAYRMEDINQAITALDLSEQKLTHIPDAVFQNIQLKVLLLNNNQLSTLSPQIGELKNLTKLDLTSNQLTELPPQIGELSNLTALGLGRNQLDNLPPQMWDLKYLAELDLWDNRLKSLPPQIGKLKNLTRLDLSGNQLTELPLQIGELKNLTRLNLDVNILDSLPLQIGDLDSLTYLDLRHNQFTNLPPQIWELKNLAVLLLGGNKLTNLPLQIGELTNLTWLDLTSNQLTELPPQIGELSNLTALGLGRNQLDNLPPQMWDLKYLSELELWDNRLKSLPPQIGELKNLTKLYLNDNKLTLLPPQIGELKNLTELDLRSNSFPESEKEKIKAWLPGCRITFLEEEADE